jgi:hypothetical protein
VSGVALLLSARHTTDTSAWHNVLPSRIDHGATDWTANIKVQPLICSWNLRKHIEIVVIRIVEPSEVCYRSLLYLEFIIVNLYLSTSQQFKIYQLTAHHNKFNSSSEILKADHFLYNTYMIYDINLHLNGIVSWKFVLKSIYICFNVSYWWTSGLVNSPVIFLKSLVVIIHVRAVHLLSLYRYLNPILSYQLMQDDLCSLGIYIMYGSCMKYPAVCSCPGWSWYSMVESKQ